MEIYYDIACEGNENIQANVEFDTKSKGSRKLVRQCTICFKVYVMCERKC